MIVADNVNDYLSAKYEAPVSGLKWFEDLPAITPPYTSTFIQFRKGLREFGAIVLRNDYKEDKFRWHLHIYILTDHEVPVQAHGEAWLTEDGKLYLENNYAGIDRNKFTLNFTAKFEEWAMSRGKFVPEYFTSIAAISSVFFWTLAFMNCKNAILESIEPNAHENKRRAKHGKLPLMRYHVLKIKPFGQRSDSEGQGGSHASPALHIRRGHFATYTDAAPLFGKYVGTYWKDQMLVGKKSNRVVVKDYEMDLTGAK